MPIEKLIKIYFVFAMVIVSMAGLTYNDYVHNYMTSVFMLDSNAESTVSQPRYKFVDVMDGGTMGATYFAANQNPSSLIFSITNDWGKAYASSGAKDIEVMKFKIKSSEKNLYLKSMKLRAVGIDISNIEKLVVSDKKGFVEEGLRVGEYFTFDTMDYEFAEDSTGELSLIVDLGEGLNSGQRLRFDIESPNDLLLMVGGKPYSVNEYYPIKGKPLSIVSKRPWSKNPNVSEVETLAIED